MLPPETLRITVLSDDVNVCPELLLLNAFSDDSTGTENPKRSLVYKV